MNDPLHGKYFLHGSSNVCFVPLISNPQRDHSSFLALLASMFLDTDCAGGSSNSTPHKRHAQSGVNTYTWVSTKRQQEDLREESSTGTGNVLQAWHRWPERDVSSCQKSSRVRLTRHKRVLNNLIQYFPRNMSN